MANSPSSRHPRSCLCPSEGAEQESTGAARTGQLPRTERWTGVGSASEWQGDGI